MSDTDPHALAGAYALDALDEHEAEDYARHLASCEACTREVAELQATAAMLARAVAETPPAGMHDRVMAAIGEAPPRTDNVVPLRRLPYLAAAACLVLAAIGGGVAVQARHQADRQRSTAIRARAQTTRLTRLMSAPDATLRAGAVHGGGNATVVTSQRLNQAVLVYRGLGGLADGLVYELWYSKRGAMVPAGLFTSGGAEGVTALNGGPQGAAAVGLTVEPAGGSPKPTSSPILLLPVRA